MKTRDGNQAQYANRFFAPTQVRDNLFVYENAAFTAEECSLIGDFCKALSEITSKPEVEIFIYGWIDKGGLKYLESVQRHLDETVLTRVGHMYLMARNLDDQQPGRWQEHIKAVRADYTTLTANVVVLKDVLKRYQQTNDNVVAGVPALKMR